MDLTTYSFTLDIHTTGSQINLMAKQGDSGRKISVTLSEKGKIYKIAKDCSAVFRAVKPDGTILFNNCEIINNEIQYVITEQTVAEEGIVDCEITLYDADGIQITSPNFTIQVASMIRSDNVLKSSNEFGVLRSIITEVNELINNVAAGDDNTANAFKGNKSGACIQIDDASPIEHSVVCKVKGRNLFNTIDDYKGYDHNYADGTLTVTGQYTSKYIEVKDGRTYTFSCKSSRTGADGGGIYIRAYSKELTDFVNLVNKVDTLSPTETISIPEGYPVIRISFYGFYQPEGSGVGTYTEIMLEEGVEATGYVPFIDPASVNVIRCGNNLFRYPYANTSYADDNLTMTVNADKSITLKGTNVGTQTRTITLATNYFLPPGRYTLGGNKKNLKVRVNAGGGAYRYSTYQFAVNAGETINIYAVVEPNEEVNYTVFPTIHIGDAALPYEEYITEKLTVNADGSVNGMTSLSPHMTVFTDTPDTLLDVEYNRDSNKVVQGIKDTLDEMLENIVTARIVDIDVPAAKWVGRNENLYAQVVEMDGITPYSQVNLTPSVEQLAVFYDKDLSFVTENDGGVITIYAIGQKPQNDYTIQATIMEVAI